MLFHFMRFHRISTLNPHTYSLRQVYTPASIMARQPPQTEAMELLPLLSVMVLSTLMVYGKSSCKPTLKNQLSEIGVILYCCTAGTTHIL